MSNSSGSNFANRSISVPDMLEDSYVPYNQELSNRPGPSKEFKVSTFEQILKPLPQAEYASAPPQVALPPVSPPPAFTPVTPRAVFSPVSSPPVFPPVPLRTTFSPVSSPSTFQPLHPLDAYPPILPPPAFPPIPPRATFSTVPSPPAFQPLYPRAAYSPVSSPPAYPTVPPRVALSPILPETSFPPVPPVATLSPVSLQDLPLHLTNVDHEVYQSLQLFFADLFLHSIKQHIPMYVNSPDIELLRSEVPSYYGSEISSVVHFFATNSKPLIDNFLFQMGQSLLVMPVSKVYDVYCLRVREIANTMLRGRDNDVQFLGFCGYVSEMFLYCCRYQTFSRDSAIKFTAYLTCNLMNWRKILHVDMYASWAKSYSKTLVRLGMSRP